MLGSRFFAIALTCLALSGACEKTSAPSSHVDPIVAAGHMSAVLSLSVSRADDHLQYDLAGDTLTGPELRSKLTELAALDNAIRIKLEPEAGISDDVLEEVAQLIGKAGLRVWTIDELHEEDAK